MKYYDNTGALHDKQISAAWKNTKELFNDLIGKIRKAVESKKEKKVKK